MQINALGQPGSGRAERSPGEREGAEVARFGAGGQGGLAAVSWGAGEEKRAGLHGDPRSQGETGQHPSVLGPGVWLDTILNEVFKLST